MRNTGKIVLTALLSMFLFGANADECRYDELNGLKGDNLRKALHDVIAEHVVLSYSAVRADNAKVDFRQDGTIWDMYSDCSFYKANFCTNTDNSECECYNREHSLPKSYWGGSQDEPMYTDLHHIIPTDFVANSQRSAWIFDEVKSATWSNGVSKLGKSKNWSGETAFEPADEYKGDFARIYFYMLTCYMDKDFTKGGKGWKIFSYSSGKTDFTSTTLSLMLKWHKNDPVSDKERLRNERVENIQGNRNPFVDDPGLAESIWNNKTYTCSGATIPSDETITGALSCLEAREAALALPSGDYSANEEIVVGYVTQIISSYDASYGNQSFWIADKKAGGQVFEAYRCRMDSAVIIGDRVAVTGKLLNYSGTPEIKNGQTQLLNRTGWMEAIEKVQVWTEEDFIGCEVYTIMGQRVGTLPEGLKGANLPAGTYILRKGNKGKVIQIIR